MILVILSATSSVVDVEIAREASLTNPGPSPRMWHDSVYASESGRIVLVGEGPDRFALDITNPTTSNPVSTSGGENITIDFTFTEGMEAVNHELADIGVTDVTVGGQACLGYVNPTKDRARKFSDLPEARRLMDAATVRGKAYIVGGRDTSGNTLDSIVEFDPVANTTKTVYNLPTAIRHASVVAYDDKVYILGGREGSSGVSTIRVYDPIENTSQEVGGLPGPRYWGAAAVAGNMIYFGGGYYDEPDPGSRSDAIFRFDPTTGESRQVNTLPMATAILTATTAYGKVYFIGGNIAWAQSNGIVEYDPVANTSAVVATFPPPGGGEGLEAQTAATLNGKVYMFNGWDNDATPNYRDEIFQFDPRTGENAVHVGTLPTQVEIGAAADIYGKAYLFGGLAPFGTIADIIEFTPPNVTAEFNLRLGVWQANCTAPHGLSGLRDLFVRANYTDHNTNMNFSANETESKAVQYPKRRPSARGLHRMVYDAESDRVILFGGASTFFNVDLNDLWAYGVPVNAWTELFPSALPSLGLGPMAYDSQSDRAILFQHGQTWAYDFNNKTWTNMMPASAPPGPADGRRGPRMDYDRESDRIVFFGGRDPATNTHFNDTWVYDFETNTWTEMHPTVTPPGRLYPGMVYDAAWDRIILFGGAVAGNRLDDTWAYDFNNDTWTPLNPASSPSPRASYGMVYDVDAGLVILFGGVGPFPSELVNNETWAYNYASNSWTRLTPSAAPSPRAWHAMVYADASDRTVLFGGGPDRDTFTRETWTYDSATNVWTLVDAPEPPVASFTFSPSGPVEGKTVTFDASASSDSDGMIVSFAWDFGDGSVANGVSVEHAYTADGTYTVTLTVTDDDRLKDSTARQVVVAPDMPPSITIAAPRGGATLTSPKVTVSGTASDDVAVEKVEISADGTEWVLATGTTSWSAVVALAIGSNTILARATDTSGNAATASVAVTVLDATNPSLAIISPVDGATVASRTVTVRGTASDDMAVEKVELSTDGVNWIRATGTTSWEGTITLSEGPNTIHARATDTSGNMAEVSISLTVQIPPPESPAPRWPLLGGVIAAAAAAGGLAALLLRRRRG